MDKLLNNNTSMFHIYISIASACLAWILFIKPLTTIGPKKSLYYMFSGILVWCIIFPIIMIASKSAYNSISDEDTFVIVKILSLVVAIIIIQGFIAGSYYGYKNNKLMTIVINIILMLNIAEACYTQLYNYINYDNDHELYNIINPIIGICLIPILIVNIIKGSGMSVVKHNMSINLYSDIKPWFIIAYSLWNTLFRIHLLPNTSTIIFFIVSIVMPIIIDFTKLGDWLQVRAITLLFIMIITFGLTPNEGNFIPIYNIQGYIKDIDDNNIFSEIQRNNIFKYIILILACISLIMSMRESWIQQSFIR